MLFVLSKCKSLCSAQLRTLLLDASKATFAGVSVFLRPHLDVVLGVASRFMLHEEGAVAPIQNVHFWIGKFWVLMGIGGPVLVT